MDRDQQPGSPWRAEDDSEALTASAAWPTRLDAARGRQQLQAIRQTLSRAEPPQPKQARAQGQERQSASG